MHILGFDAHPWPRLSFGSLRIWDAGARWNELQPSAGRSWDASALARLDALVKTADDHGVKPMLVLGQTPAWASIRPTEQATYGAGAAAPPRHLADWTRYVSFLAHRYRGRIEAYQVWNEPSFTNQWSGSVQELASLTKAAHDAVKAADPSALVVSPGVPLENFKSTPFLRAYLPLVRDKIDVLGVHLYPAPHHTPESVTSLVRAARDIADNAGVDAPMWNTEENLGSRYSGDHYVGAKAAAWTARALLLAPEFGVQRTYWYAAYDHVWGAVDLLDPTNTAPTQAGVAERAVRSWLVGALPLGCTPGSKGGGVWRCTFRLANGTPAQAVWTTHGTTTITPPSGARVARRIDGSSHRIAAGISVTTTPELLLSGPNR